MRMSPPSGASNPAISRSIVVLPHPEGPSSVQNSPSATENDTASTAATPSKRFDTSRHSTILGVIAERLSAQAGTEILRGNDLSHFLRPLARVRVPIGR